MCEHLRYRCTSVNYGPGKYMYSWEFPNYSLYYFDSKDVSDKYLRTSKKSSPDKDAQLLDVVTDAKGAEGVAFKFVSRSKAGLTKILFGEMDEWYEEDEQIFVHPRDPYKVLFFYRQSITHSCLF